MRKIAFLLILCFGFLEISAQMSAPRKERRRSSLYIVDNTGAIKQKQALDSAINKNLSQEENLPADEFYDEWSTKGVNAGRVAIVDVPDSVTLDITGYIPPIEGRITSRYGPRWGRFHYGIDIKLNTGDPLGSAFDGKVRITKYDRGGYGSYVVVRHDNGLETVYGHLSKVLVEEGQQVRAGEIIGLGGNTGHSTGAHLHFETRFLGNPINPEQFFDFELGEAKRSLYFMVKETAFDWHKPYKIKAKRKARAKARQIAISNSAGGSSCCHKVKKGETLSCISRKYGISVTDLCKLNGINRNKSLRLGQPIRYN